VIYLKPYLNFAEFDPIQDQFNQGHICGFQIEHATWPMFICSMNEKY